MMKKSFMKGVGAEAHGLAVLHLSKREKVLPCRKKKAKPEKLRTLRIYCVYDH